LSPQLESLPKRPGKNVKEALQSPVNNYSFKLMIVPSVNGRGNHDIRWLLVAPPCAGAWIETCMR